MEEERKTMEQSENVEEARSQESSSENFSKSILTEKEELDTGNEEKDDAAEKKGSMVQPEEENSRKSLNVKKIPTWCWAAAIAVLAAVIVVVVIVYLNSPGYRANRAFELGERYLEEMDYDRAIAQFTAALMIDPENEELREEICVRLEEILSLAEGYGEAGDYNAELEMTTHVLDFAWTVEQVEGLLPEAEDIFRRAREIEKEAKKGKAYELVEKADQEFEEGKYEEAEEDYTEALKEGLSESEVGPRRRLCDRYLKLLELCKKQDWTGVAAFIDSTDFDVIADYMSTANPQFISREINVLIGERDGVYYVITGDLTEEQGSGNGIGVISSVNTYACYDGPWKDYIPEGSGQIKVWNKNEEMASAIIYDGTFKNGLVDGNAMLTTLIGEKATAIGVSVMTGGVGIRRIDDAGRLLVSENGEEIYFALNETERKGIIANYEAGVPGFGGSDRKIKVSTMDTIPPVLTCSLEIGKTYDILDWNNPQIPFGAGITAVDNIDGDITDQITWEEERTADSFGNNSDLEYGLIVTYSATDSSGNTGTLTVKYDFTAYCEAYYQVIWIGDI